MEVLRLTNVIKKPFADILPGSCFLHNNEIYMKTKVYIRNGYFTVHSDLSVTSDVKINAVNIATGDINTFFEGSDMVTPIEGAFVEGRTKK